MNHFRQITFLDYLPTDLPEAVESRITSYGEKASHTSSSALNLGTLLAETDCLLLRLGGAADEKLFASSPNLKYIGMLGTGVGRVDLPGAQQRGITVTNLVGYSTNAVAELTVMLMIAHLREFSRSVKHASNGDYSEATFSGSELASKKVGIIGMGKIGCRVAQILRKGFDCEVLYFSRTREPNVEAELGVKYCAQTDLLEHSDIVTLHLPAVSGMPALLGADSFSMMRSGSLLINTSPMELIDMNALVSALQSGKLSFITDHSDELAEGDARKLAGFHNCLLIPPIGYTTHEASNNKYEMFCSNIEQFLLGRPVNVVRPH